MRVLILMTVLALSACASMSREPDFATDLTAQGLQPSTSSTFKVFYVKEDFEFASAVVVETLDSSQTIIEENTNSSTWQSRNRTTWELTDADQARLSEAFSNSIADAFSNSSIGLTTDTAGQLVITPKLAKIRPNAPRDTFDNRGPGESYYSEGSGDMWVVFEGRVDGELVLWMEQRSQAGQLWEINNRVTTWRNTRTILSRWARSLEKQLSELEVQ